MGRVRESVSVFAAGPGLALPGRLAAGQAAASAALPPSRSREKEPARS
jgi:hypothetical protein